MKKLIALCLALTVASVSAADLKIAVVDLTKVFNDYTKTKEADARIKEQMSSFQKEGQDRMADYQKMVDEVTKLRDAANDPTLSPAAKADKQKAFDTKVQEVKDLERKIREFQTQRSKQIQDAGLRMRANLVDDITKVINDYGAREKYNLILDKSGSSVNGTSFMLYTQDLKDVTDDITKLVNASAKAAPATGSAPAAAATTPSSTPAASTTDTSAPKKP